MSKKGALPSIGILGGGQLGKMMAQAAADWDLNIHFLDPTASAPASCCAEQTIGSFKDYDTVMKFAAGKEIITIEIEDVNLKALKELEETGKKVYPRPSSLEIIQDKGCQKDFFKKEELPSAPYHLTHTRAEIEQLLQKGQIQFPFVQKLRKSGYDGKGVQIIKEKADLDTLFDEPSVIEDKIKIKKEIAVLAARNASGQVALYDPVEMVFHPTANLLLYQECPAQITKDQIKCAAEMATQLLNKLNIVGLLAVELFIDETGQLLINELAPRPHNSGHHTIEACMTSQFQQHLRAILNLPLGTTTTRGYSLLLNVLGEPGFEGSVVYQNLDECLALDGVYVHLYGKKMTKPFRKMGHVTVLGTTRDEVLNKAEVVQQKLKAIT